MKSPKIDIYFSGSSNFEEETVISPPFEKLQQFVLKLLKRRVSSPSDAEDISQEVFRRSWQWAEKKEKNLTLEDWKRIIARITFNEINRFYSKNSMLLFDDLVEEDSTFDVVAHSLNPQFVLEIAQALQSLPFRQRLSIVLHDAEILPYLNVVLSKKDIADLLEITEQTYLLLEERLPLSEVEITELIEALTNKSCKSSIRDERCKGRKTLKSRLFGI